MKTSTLLLLLLGLLLVAAPFSKVLVRAEDAEEAADEYDVGEEDEAPAETDEDALEKDVVVGTVANFDDLLKKHKFALVEFYAPWCGHCKKLKPEWAKAATALKASSPDVLIAKVDATVEGDLGKKYGVQGYPTIKWFVDGEFVADYSAGREADDIVKWVQKKSGPPAITVETADALSDLEAAEAVVVLGYFKEFKGAEFDVFSKVAQTTEDVTFAQTTDAAAAKQAGLTKPGVAVIANHAGQDRAAVPLTGDVTAESVTELINSEKLPLTIEFNDQNSNKIFNSGIAKQVLLVASSDDLKTSSKVFTAYQAVSKALKGKLVFVTVDLDGSSKDPVVNFFGLKAEDAPVVVGFEVAAGKKYKLSGAFSEESLLKFAEGLLDGSVAPEYKSAEIPENDKDADVTIVVGKSFDKIVKDPTKDVLLEVYAPWCGHCKSLEPIYKKLAKRFKKVESVVVAKMDGTENEHPDLDVKGFPTILFFPAEEGASAITFDGGDRSLKALTKFIKKHAKVPYELTKKGGKDDEEVKDEL